MKPYSEEHDCDLSLGVVVTVIEKARKRWRNGKTAEAPRTTRRWVWHDFNGFRHTAWTTENEGPFHEKLASEES